MKVAIDLKAMTVAEKLELLDAIWADLSQDEENIPSPAWHEAVLRDRAERFKRGEEQGIPWEKAKQQLLREQK
jgi:hypothetical protein